MKKAPYEEGTPGSASAGGAFLRFRVSGPGVVPCPDLMCSGPDVLRSYDLMYFSCSWWARATSARMSSMSLTLSRYFLSMVPICCSSSQRAA
jgi:hypothetical protein